MGVLRNDVQQAGIDAVHQGLQLGLGACTRAVIVCCLQRGQHSGQIVGMHARDAQRGEVGCCGLRAGVGRRVHDGVHGQGQGFDFGDAVHLRGAGLADHVVQQALGRAVVGHGRGGAGPDGGVSAGRGVDVGRGIGVAAIGFGQDQAVGVDQGLHAGRVAQLCAGDGGGRQGALDGRLVARVNAGDACGGEVCQGGRSAACWGGAVACVSLNQRDGRLLALLRQQDLCMVLLRLRHQGLQFGQGVDACGVVGRCGHQSQEHRQVVRIQAGDAQGCERSQIDVGQGRGRGRLCGQGLQLGHSSGQSFDLGHGVDIGCGHVADGVVQQGQARSAQARCGAGTDGGVSGRSRIAPWRGIGGAAIGFGQDAVEGIDQCLHNAGSGEAGGLDRCGGQCALDGSQIARVHAGDAQQQEVVEHRSVACKGVGGIARVVLNAEKCYGNGVSGRLGDEGLQFGQGVHRAAVVSGRGNLCQHKRQVVRRDARDAQGREIGFGQRRCGRVACGGGHDGLCAHGQSLDLGHAVHTAGGLCTDDGVEQRLGGRAIGEAGSSVGTDGAVVRNRGVGRRVGIDSSAVGLAQDAVVGIDQGLNFGRAVHRRTHHTGGGQCAVEG